VKENQRTSFINERMLSVKDYLRSSRFCLGSRQNSRSWGSDQTFDSGFAKQQSSQTKRIKGSYVSLHESVRFAFFKQKHWRFAKGSRQQEGS